MAAALGIALVYWLAPAQPTAPEPEAGLCDVAVRTEVLGFGDFAKAATIRLPAIRLREASGDVEPACSGRLHGYVELRLIDEGTWEMILITSDGRAWFRTVASEPDQAARALASALANLLAAIEDASTEPDAHDVTLPSEIEEAAELALPATATPPARVEPDLDSSGPSERGRVLFELGPRSSGAVVIGLVPGPGFRGAGGGVGLDLQLPSGLGFGLDVRVLSATAADLTLVRTRVALGVGGVVRNGRFELPVIVSGVVEPWVVQEAGNIAALRQPPMIGGGARVAPGLLLPIASATLRLGLQLGFELAVEAAPGGLTPAIARGPTSEPILRAGGVEFAAGLELGVWIPIRERKSK